MTCMLAKSAVRTLSFTLLIFLALVQNKCYLFSFIKLARINRLNYNNYIISVSLYILVKGIYVYIEYNGAVGRYCK